ncbi:MAG: WYL domain-containing protein [Candidatus Eremiobacteraeota bacterium]|nr:WYL domain-containing protein [Candidatus Eremiobacteraeota bacterium]
MKENEHTKAQIFLKMFMLIASNPLLSPQEVQKSLAIGKDRYHRYFNELSSIVPVTYSRDEKRYRFESEKESTQLVVNEKEFYTFLSMLHGVSKSRGSDCAEALDTLKKLRWTDPSVEHMKNYCVFLDESDMCEDLPLNLFQLNKAILARRRIAFAYQAEKKFVPRIRAEPLRLLHDSWWYLLGNPVDNGYERGFRFYKISRMREIEILEEQFVMPDPSRIKVKRMSIPWDFTPSGESEPEEVVVEFSGSATRYIREIHYHHTQKVSDLPGGRLRFSVEVMAPQLMVNWILSFGGLAVVIEPGSLREAVAGEARRIYGLYGKE